MEVIMSLGLFLQIIPVVLSISGIIFNIHKKRACWIIWTIGSIFWIGLYVYTQLWIPIILCVINIGMNIWGWKKWSKENK